MALISMKFEKDLSIEERWRHDRRKDAKNAAEDCTVHPGFLVVRFEETRVEFCVISKLPVAEHRGQRDHKTPYPYDRYSQS